MDVSDYPERTDLVRAVIAASGFAGRLAGLDPQGMTDEQLAAAAAEYRLVRLRVTTPLTGPGGPGDLAWFWPLAAVVFWRL